MGGKSSKDGEKELPLPVDRTPYRGPPVQHRFLVTEVAMSKGFGTVKSKLDEVLPVLAQQMDQGQELLTFYRIPGASCMTGLISSSSPFLAIFRDRASVREDRILLQYIKSTIQSQYGQTGLFSGVYMETDVAPIFSAINQQASQGARFICAELTGQAVMSSFSERFRGLGPTQGVDIFFEGGYGPQRFVYEMVSVPVKRKARFGNATVECDWMGVLSSKLKQGWRLVEIFYDNGMMLNPKLSRYVRDLNTEWFFEKPIDKLHDPTPLWQGCYVEFFIKLKGRFGGGVKTETHWESYITAMGARGWELACILDTPEMYRTGFSTVEMKCILFFQRPILPLVDAPPAYHSVSAPTTQVHPGRGASPHGLPPPPSYMSIPEGYAYGGKE